MAAKADKLQATWRRLMAEHARVSDALERELRERHGLSVTEYEVLRRLTEAEAGQERMQDLAAAVHLSQSALTRLVTRLESDGLIARSVCGDDRRGVWACITDAGRATERAAAPTQRAVLASTLPSA